MIRSDHLLPYHGGMPEHSINDSYVSPLVGRYASKEMQAVWSPRRKFETWRKIWLAAAEAMHAVGLPVTAEQCDELRANLDVTDADIARAAELEADLRHDVMAHVHAWGERCPTARPIIHLGMTSQDVNDNCELDQMISSCARIDGCAKFLISTLGVQAGRLKSLPCLGFTHYQPAQPVTVGRRLAQYAHDLALCRERFWDLHTSLPYRGLRGATGTQASYLKLCDGDAERVDLLERNWFFRMRGERGQDRIDGCIADGLKGELPGSVPLPAAGAETITLATQTYPRVLDAVLVAQLASVCAVLHKMATDIRLLCNRKELDEPFGDKQIGSSAMPYKRNPMRCERVCGLARFVMNLVGNAYETAATQWLERTLDDSSNRRLVLPEAFLATEACLNIMANVIGGLVVHEKTVRKNLMAELPFLATENILMEAVKRGGDRQDLHEKIRVHAQAAGQRVKHEGLENDLIERLRRDRAFASIHDLLDEDREGGLLDPMSYVGLAVAQTERFLVSLEHLRGEEQDGPGAPDLRV